MPAAPEGASGPWPTGELDRAALSVDAAEVTRVAAFGPVPRQWIAWPAYALRVRLRRRALRRLLQARQSDLAAAVAERDELLSQLAAGKRHLIEGDSRLSPLLDTVRELERTAGEHGQALASANAEYSARAQKLEVELAARREPYAAATTAEQARVRGFVEREQAHKRLIAQQDGLRMEIRSAETVAAQAALARGLPERQLAPEHAAELQQLSARAERLAGEQATQAAELQRARSELEAARRELAELARRVREVEMERRALDREFKQRLAQGTQGFSEVERRRQAALADVGRALLKHRDSLSLGSDMLHGLIEADARVAKAALTVETHSRAVTAYDRARVSDGDWILGAAVLVVVLVVVLLIWLT
jgi:chromosome segregation ATPase